MTYSKDEVENIKSNLAKIEAFVKENYVPRLRRNEEVSVQFGPLKRYPGQWEPEPEFAFGFDFRGEAYFKTGGLRVYFTQDTDGPFRSVYQNWHYATDLLLNWSQVKQQIEQELNERDRKRAALAAFEV